jgi:predicted nucleotide-binding protein (sugar kinase/HSP70/actin superfamily)
VRIGLPQALLNYEFGDRYAAFFRELGATVVHSPVSNRQVLELGLAATVDEACLPVKLALGHVAALRDRCDLIFLPRIVSWQAGEYSCPELMGLPDVARAGLGATLPLLSPVIDLHHRRRSLLDIAREVAAPLTDDRRSIERALAVALATPFRAAPVAAARDRENADVTIAVTGEPYVINDPLISLDLLARLRRLGAHVRTVSDGSADADATAGHGAVATPGRGVDRVPYWTLCRQSS